jgi:Lysyl oxidase
LSVPLLPRRVRAGAVLIAVLLLAAGAAEAARGDGCRHHCAVERRECRQAMKLEKRRERKVCETAADPTQCHTGVETRMHAQLTSCMADRRSCRRCCRGGTSACLAARAVEFCGTAADCDDGDACTDDICDGALGCLHAPLSAPCNDGNACTAGDACADGACVGGSPAPGCTACTGAAVIPPQGGMFLGATSGTGALAGSCPNSDAAPERVYQWTPTRSGTAVISTCGSGTGYDTIVYLRSGSCEAGSEVGCNDDTTGCAVADGTSGADHHGSSLTAAVTAGETYFIVVDGFQGKGGSYALTVVPPSVCGDGVREGPEQCDGTDRTRCASGLCAADCSCVPPTSGLPDLVPAIGDVTLQRGTTVPPGDVAEGCAAATSGIDLLRFSTTARNTGTADVVLGDPQCPDCITHPLAVCGNPQVICSPAGGHGHGHYSNYARYELLDSTGRVAVVGRKQGFCLRDSICPSPVYTCTFQGISAGCADVYGANLGCQYLDVTGVPDGNYTLRVTLDPFGRIAELDETNNVTTQAVTLGSDTCAGATDLPATGGTFTGTTAGASTESGSCAAQTALAPEHVFRWTPAVSGAASISTCAAAAGFDTVVYVREASCNGTEVACNDDTEACAIGDGCLTADHHGSVVTPSVTAGQTYFIFVDGFAGSCGGSQGAFTLSVVPPLSGGLITTTTTLVTTTTLAALTTTTIRVTTTTLAPTTTSTTLVTTTTLAASTSTTLVTTTSLAAPTSTTLVTTTTLAVPTTTTIRITTTTLAPTTTSTTLVTTTTLAASTSTTLVTTTTLAPRCGDGVINQPGETCDPPGSVPASPGGNVCRADCTYCGDGVANNGEACDDGNGDDGDSCRNDCTCPSGDSVCANPLLGIAATCKVLQLGGGKVDLTGPAGGVDGHTCIGPSGELAMSGSQFVAGDVRLGAGATFSKSGSTIVGGTVLSGEDLSSEVDAAKTVSADAAAKTCTQNLGTLKTTQTILANGGPGPTVLCVQDVDVTTGSVITLSGGPGDTFIINVTGKFKVNGGRIVVAGVQPSDVLYNVRGLGEQVAFSGGGGGTDCCKASVDGTLLAPDRDIALSPGLVDGAVISGRNISIVSGAAVSCPPPPPCPAG